MLSQRLLAVLYSHLSLVCTVLLLQQILQVRFVSVFCCFAITQSSVVKQHTACSSTAAPWPQNSYELQQLVHLFTPRCSKSCIKSLPRLTDSIFSSPASSSPILFQGLKRCFLYLRKPLLCESAHLM